jgi:hypothetical protein
VGFLLKKSTRSLGERAETVVFACFSNRKAVKTAQKFINVKLILKMKKNLFFLLLLALVAMSCQKDIEQGSIGLTKTNEVTSADSKETSLFDQTKPVENDDVYVKIDAFKAKLAKIEAGTMPETDAGTTVSDAIWNIEALLNSRYGQAGRSFGDINNATSTIRVTLNDDGTIDNAALLAAAEAARQKLSDQFHAIANSNKHVINVDIRKKEPQTESGGSVIFDVSSMIGIDEPEPPFDEGDNWLYSDHRGKCNNGGQVGKDAADKLALSINSRTLNADIFFTDVQSRTEYEGGSLNPDPNDIRGDNLRDNVFFIQEYDGITVSNPKNANYSDCIKYKDMIYYLNSAKYDINRWKPSGKTFIDIFIYGDATLPSPRITVHLHIPTIQYGIAHYTGGAVSNPL